MTRKNVLRPNCFSILAFQYHVVHLGASEPLWKEENKYILHSVCKIKDRYDTGVYWLVCVFQRSLS